MEVERDGVGDVEKDVAYLTDFELRQRLLNFGANIGPVTGMFHCPKFLEAFVCLHCANCALWWTN